MNLFMIYTQLLSDFGNWIGAFRRHVLSRVEFNIKLVLNIYFYFTILLKLILNYTYCFLQLYMKYILFYFLKISFKCFEILSYVSMVFFLYF